MLSKTISGLPMHARGLPASWVAAARVRPGRASPSSAAFVWASMGGLSKDKDPELPFPDLPPVQEDDEVPPNVNPAPEPDNPLPDDLPGNHPSEPPPKSAFPEVDPMPDRPAEPLRSPPEAPVPDVPQESPPVSPTEFPGGPAPNEFGTPAPQEWP